MGETIIETLCLLQLTEVHFSSLDKEVVKTDNYGKARNSLKEDRSCHKKFLFLTFHLLSNCAIQKPLSFITV